MVRQIKGIEESTLEVDFSVPFTRNCYVIYLLKWNLKLFLNILSSWNRDIKTSGNMP